jgi:methionyl aminopeptidase
MTEYITVAPDDRVEPRNGVIKLHGPEAFEGMRRSGRLAASILDSLASQVVPGITTGEIDSIVYRLMVEGGSVPATLGYRGFTRSCCTSINHVVCHGIPGDRVLKDGDIVNIDVTPVLDGWHGDTSRMFLVGNVAIKARRLVDVTYECLMLGLEQAKPGNHLGDIANAIQTHAEKAPLQRRPRFLRTRARAACSTTAPKSSTRVGRAPGPSSRPACSSPSSR